MKKTFLVGAAALVGALLALPGALARPAADPGVTSRSILLGGTFPLSGPASSYAPIPVGIRAYFSYINARRARDGTRGVYSRQIIWRYRDDGYNPANTVQLHRQLVEQDRVFAVFGTLGTEPNLPIRPYLNQQKVPHLLVSTGASYWGLEYRQYPYTIGWQPDYIAEGTLYGRYIRQQRPGAKIGVLFQNDDYGKDYVAGLERGLGTARNLIAERQGCELPCTSLASQLSRLRASGADVLAIFALPTPTIVAYATLRALNWKPDLIILNSVSATDAFLAVAQARAGADYVNGSISTAYLKDPANSQWNNDAGMKLYKRLMAKYAPGARASDVLYLYGMAKAHDMVRLLYLAGRNPTRASLIRATQNMNWTNPFALPGVRVKTSRTDRFPISQIRLQRYNNGTWTSFGALIDGRAEG